MDRVDISWTEIEVKITVTEIYSTFRFNFAKQTWLVGFYRNQTEVLLLLQIYDILLYLVEINLNY